MSKQIQIRRGTATEHETFTGAIGEVTMDTTNNTLCVHDGQTPGGVQLAKQSALDAADYVVETWHSTDGKKWYRKYKSGWVEQGGTVAGGNSVITYPIPMANTYYTRTVTANRGNNTAITGCSFNSVTTTGAKLFASNLNHEGWTPISDTTMQWYICGIAAE